MRTSIPSSMIVLFISFAHYSFGQDVPKMWVHKDSSRKRIDLFQSQVFNQGTLSKEIILDKASGNGNHHPLNYFVSMDGFENLMKQIEKIYPNSLPEGSRILKIYIGASPVAQSAGSPYGQVAKNQLILIFAPVSVDEFNYYHDIGAYFVIHLSNYTVSSISTPDKKALTENYVSSIIGNKNKGFVSTIEDSQENYDGTALSDTKAISYYYRDFAEFFRKERSLQDHLTPNNKISGIKICLAAYPNYGIGKNNDFYMETQFKNRLFLIFELTKKNSSGGEEIFYIDDSGGFGNRPHPKAVSMNSMQKLNINAMMFLLEAVEKQILLFNYGADTGQLCPPKCN
jgi:hypothetical protein